MKTNIDFYKAFENRPRPADDEILTSDVNHDGDRIQELLSTNDRNELSLEEIKFRISGNLYGLTAKAFLYYLPRFLDTTLEQFEELSVFGGDLIFVLTLPERNDMMEAMDNLAHILPPEVVDYTKKQQTDFFDIGHSTDQFRDRFENLSFQEGKAILFFVRGVQERYEDYFLPDELQTAINRYWIKYN